MARNLGLDDGVDIADRIRVEAAQLFHHRGYGMTAIRDIAEAAGISSSTMYHHYRNKQEVLFAISRHFMTEFNAALLPILNDATRSPRDRLDAAIELHLLISNERRTELLTIRGNRTALSPDQLATIILLQTTYQRSVRDVVAAIRGSEPVAAELITMALMDLINGVCHWFAPTGPLTIDEITERYLHMAHALVAAESPSRS
ncbi:TetR family transcriptional regulator [Nocardia sp. SYP-A9097]|uniref:TetR/AcrR family transcriptional regulator n=1 Tax=Nocardia sp. SYP-A9097 TaxID=2663237 RepID=UPI00129BFC5E|nr:TetR/AcrR family transcriptional regulator [Nocardia sp. SYP-A9097]MRH87920.1 TetR family transcriptional regulator [Nocardia sp. SYP-A9097]